MTLAMRNDPRRKRVAAFTIAIARAMGIPTEEIRVLARIAVWYDLPPHRVPFPGAVEVLSDHDGTGYPRRRLRDQIPLRTHILKVAVALESGMIDWRIHPSLVIAKTNQRSVRKGI